MIADTAQLGKNHSSSPPPPSTTTTPTTITITITTTTTTTTTGTVRTLNQRLLYNLRRAPTWDRS